MIGNGYFTANHGSLPALEDGGGGTDTQQKGPPDDPATLLVLRPGGPEREVASEPAY